MKIKISRNKRDRDDFFDPPRFSGRLRLGELSLLADFVTARAYMEYDADGDTEEEVTNNIRSQVEKDYRRLMREIPNLGGMALRIAQKKIENIRTVYAPPHPITTEADMLAYHKAKKSDYMTCLACYDMFSLSVYKVKDGIICCPRCGAGAESWQPWLD